MKAAKILWLFILAFNFQSFSQKAKFVSQSRGTFIKVLPQHFSDETSTFFDAFRFTPPPSFIHNDTIFIGLDSGFYKSNTEEILFILQKDGHRSETQLVTLDEVRSHKKRVVLKKTKTLPLRNKDGAYILVEQVDLFLNRNDFTEYFYESYEDLKSRNPDRTEHSERDVIIQKTIFRDLMNEFLIKTHYMDPLQSSDFNSFDRIKLKIIISSVSEHHYSQFCLLELKCVIKFESSFQNKEVEKEYTAFSNINYNVNNKVLIEEALENLFINMIKDPEMKQYFENPEKELKKLNDSLVELEIKNTSRDSSNLETAANAVVTIVEKSGLASACIVSNDGYMITNYHVVNADTSDLYVIFNSGAKKRCRFIRANPMYDLALLKVDTTLKPIKINLSNQINVGAAVHIIGTQQSISLGQSINKGIISAKRTLKNKVYIQCDVSIIDSNSGGALTNKDGELIGILNSKLVSNGIEKASLAIPAFYLEEFLKMKIVK